MKIMNIIVVSFVLISSLFVLSAGMAISMEPMGLGIPLSGGAEEPDYDLCPQGVQLVRDFIKLWEIGRFDKMYEMIDDSSKVGYTLEDAVFDMRMLTYKDYTISQITELPDGNYEFLLSYGDWKGGDKDLKKMIISGKTFKIIMPAKNTFFKVSQADYF